MRPSTYGGVIFLFDGCAFHNRHPSALVASSSSDMAATPRTVALDKAGRELCWRSVLMGTSDIRVPRHRLVTIEANNVLYVLWRTGPPTPRPVILLTGKITSHQCSSVPESSAQRLHRSYR
jgi:hypothetical protein